ncbi:unnamed protein product [Lepeophtheirus salmonis]|uniref:(salmon louse) hypothetical protein n=1 Tax=Lepeophtheirus salmonis TaxID=72036 RepID=A0A7R8CPE4_LEPSM|nr:unnamed protein product [Lepeophtheirus salmonis]CAF2885524.1 unnamed protein product [Lepeophtheirus salmonis]
MNDTTTTTADAAGLFKENNCNDTGLGVSTGAPKVLKTGNLIDNEQEKGEEVELRRSWLLDDSVSLMKSSSPEAEDGGEDLPEEEGEEKKESEGENRGSGSRGEEEGEVLAVEDAAPEEEMMDGVVEGEELLLCLLLVFK